MLACEYVRGSCSYGSTCWYLELYQRVVTQCLECYESNVLCVV